MKIENTGVHATPGPAANVSAANKVDSPRKGSVTGAESVAQKQRVADSVALSGGRAERAVSGDYSAKVSGARAQSKLQSASQRELQPMSELKKTADARLKQFGQESDTVESISELNLDDDRKDMVEIAKLRVSSGFYDRPDVIDEIARRIIEGV
jgi:fructose-1,6-bisphosphatase/sedoheptulose 1,7-bisphosphatase-like protein